MHKSCNWWSSWTMLDRLTSCSSAYLFECVCGISIKWKIAFYKIKIDWKYSLIVAIVFFVLVGFHVLLFKPMHHTYTTTVATISNVIKMTHAYVLIDAVFVLDWCSSSTINDSEKVYEKMDKIFRFIIIPLPSKRIIIGSKERKRFNKCMFLKNIFHTKIYNYLYM